MVEVERTSMETPAIGAFFGAFLCVTGLLPAVVAYDFYRLARTGDFSALPPVLLVGCLVVCAVHGLQRAARLTLARRWAALGKLGVAVACVCVSVQVFAWPLFPGMPCPFGGAAMLRRGTMDRVFACTSPPELVRLAAPLCAAAAGSAAADPQPETIRDRLKWPAWLSCMQPGSVFVRLASVGTASKPAAWALEVHWGGGLIGHWGVQIVPGGVDDLAPHEPSDLIAPGIVWFAGP